MPKWRAVLFGLKYTRDALKALQAVEPKKVRRQIKERIDALAQAPNPPGVEVVQNAKHEGGPVYRVRQGDYRILYAVTRSPGGVIVLYIRNRREAYREWQ